MPSLHFQVEQRVAIITLNRPEKRNALNGELVEELSGALLKAEQDANVRAVILKANGNTFCSGADLDQLRAMQQNSFEENLQDSSRLKDLFYQIYSHKKIVVAQVDGFALAGGCGLATVCDYCFATPEAKFGYTEARIGFVPAIVMVFLIRKIGERNARQLLLGADIISANEAMTLGLITRLVPTAELQAFVWEFVQKLIVQNSGQSMAITKAMMAKVQGLSVADALQFAAEENAHARATDDCRQGVEAFLSKKPLSW